MSHRLRCRVLIGPPAERSQDRLSLASRAMATAATMIRARNLTGAARRYDFSSLHPLMPHRRMTVTVRDPSGFSRALYLRAELIVTPSLVRFCMIHAVAGVEDRPEKPGQTDIRRTSSPQRRNAVVAPRVTAGRTRTAGLGLPLAEHRGRLGPGYGGPARLGMAIYATAAVIRMARRPFGSSW